VTVQLASNPSVTATTSSGGAYELRNIPEDGREFTVVYTKPGYTRTLAVARAQDRYTTLKVVLLPEQVRLALDGTKDEEVTVGGGKVKIQANSILDSAGNPISNPQVAATVATPSDSRFLDAVPGLFSGVLSGMEVPVTAYGLLHVSVTDPAGNPAKLDPNKPATVEIPVTAGFDPGVPQILVWSLDEATGRWTAEAVANRDETTSPKVYRAELKHFSWWALQAYPQTFRRVVVNVVADPDVKPPVPVPGVMVRIRPAQTSAGPWEGRGVTDSNGSVTFYAPFDSSVTLNVVEAVKERHQAIRELSRGSQNGSDVITFWVRPLDTGLPGGP